MDLAARASDADVFVARVGLRVRAARERQGMARRVLSDRSGVSQRYLALLENGDGNISIGLLHKVAGALRSSVAQLVAEDGEDRRRRICLIGLRGAGKSTLGRRLGDALAMPFRELNRDIEQQSGMPVTELMALYGQEGYRRLERQALEGVAAATDAVVLAVAGGIVSETETYAFLLQNFHAVWLTASAEDHMNRVRAQGDLRPMAGNPQAMQDLQSILSSREALYARAEATVSTSGKTPDESARELVAAVRRLGIV